VTPAERREAILAEARNIAGQLSPQAAKQAAIALAILRRQGSRALQRALSLRPPSGGSARDWEEFSRVFTPGLLQRFSSKPGSEELALLLGWVKRLGVINESLRPGCSLLRGRKRN
jgi:hypothetical protein